MEYYCEAPIGHACLGPLILTKHNGKEAIYCSEFFKELIRHGEDLELIRRVPRTEILKELQDTLDKHPWGYRPFD